MMGGVPPRSEMTPPIQMTAGPPLIAPGTMQAAAAPPQFAFVPQGHYSQVAIYLYLIKCWHVM